MEIGLVRKVDIDQEMQQSYLDYAMSVIVARALPDARDGLKPVQRRILYAMHDMGLRSEAAYKKSARIVGEVLGKYHPHGDVAVYEAMARLAQTFSMRYPLVDGQGNFGSVDGDPPAAMRYTEARLMPFAVDLLAQIDRDTINFVRNFDDTLDEPEVLPAALPNLLVNGASGIAVGMATNIPPHNLGEVVDALGFMLEKWERLEEISVSDLVQYIQGPDLPTGGIILQDQQGNDLLSAYGSGRGRVTVRGRVHFEEMGRGRNRMIITELPYQTNKAALIERIAELVREGTLEGIADLRDESDRQGMRVVIELKQAADGEGILRQLYRRTPLETTLSISLLALVNGEPRLLSLKQALRVYLEHRLEVVRRRSEYDLARARQRLHILEGLRIALSQLDEVIATIRNAPDVETARERLIKRFKLSELQAQAILEMQLRRLAALERKKIEQEYKELLAQIKELEALLKSPKKMREVVRAELLEMRQRYADRRRTQIVALREGEVAADLLTATDLTPAQVVWVGLMPDGVIARTQADELPRISGRQAPMALLRTNTHHTLYLVTRSGRAAAVAVHAIPEAATFAEGVAVSKVCALTTEEEVVGLFSLPQTFAEDGPTCYVTTVSREGLVKKTLATDLPGPSMQAFVLVKMNPGDVLQSVLLTQDETELLLVTEHGMLIRFAGQEVRPMGLLAAGVNGIKLMAGDHVLGAERVQEGTLLLAASNGMGWRFEMENLPLQGRAGQGVIGCKLPSGVKLIGLMGGEATQTGIVHFQQAAARLVRMGQIEVGKRAGKGLELVPLKEGDALIHLTVQVDGLSFWMPKKPATAAGRTKSRAPKQLPLMQEKALPTVRKSAQKSAAEKPATRGKPAESTTKQKVSRKPKSVEAEAEKKPTRKARKGEAA